MWDRWSSASCARQWAVGSLSTMFILAYRPLVTKPGIKLLAAVFGFGLCIIVFGISKSFYLLSFAALFISGMMDGISVIIRQTILAAENAG